MSKILFKLKYSKLLLLLLTFVMAYFLFKNKNFLPFYDVLLSLGFFGTFLAGIFFAYGFTAAPATAILLILAKEQNIFLSGIVAGFGALIGDLLIFKFVRYSFAEEIKKISKLNSLNYTNKKILKVFKKYLIIVLAGFIIASPLPDEIGVSLLAGITTISTKKFSIISYSLNTIGIFIILVFGTLI